MSQKLNIVNRKARYEFQLEKVYTAGIILTSTEIKSIRLSNVNINDAYCYFKGDELFVKNMYVGEYEQAFDNKQHDMRRERKLLLNREELDKIKRKLEIKGFTIVVTKLFLSDKGWVKLEVATAKGKKLFDKRQTTKEREVDRELQRKIKA